MSFVYDRDNINDALKLGNLTQGIPVFKIIFASLIYVIKHKAKKA